MIVVDASVIADALFLEQRRDLRAALARQTLHAPALIDYEFLSVARGFVLGRHVTVHRAQDALTDFGDLAIRRHPMTPALREAAWDLRNQLTAYDASYAALARLLGAPLWTLDTRLARSCPSDITVVQH